MLRKLLQRTPCAGGFRLPYKAWHLPNLGQPEAFHGRAGNFLRCVKMHMV